MNFSTKNIWCDTETISHQSLNQSFEDDFCTKTNELNKNGLILPDSSVYLKKRKLEKLHEDVPRRKHQSKTMLDALALKRSDLFVYDFSDKSFDDSLYSNVPEDKSDVNLRRSILGESLERKLFPDRCEIDPEESINLIKYDLLSLSSEMNRISD
ncbi:hypothetical protein SSS_03395 [Sarcoptes scabiei]|nr:hypothetical protein SSS_03395 [Sarcoptes scabiei]